MAAKILQIQNPNGQIIEIKSIVLYQQHVCVVKSFSQNWLPDSGPYIQATVEGVYEGYKQDTVDVEMIQLYYPLQHRKGYTAFDQYERHTHPQDGQPVFALTNCGRVVNASFNYLGASILWETDEEFHSYETVVGWRSMVMSH